MNLFVKIVNKQPDNWQTTKISLNETFFHAMSKRKAPNSLNNPNQAICDMLIELAVYEQNVNKNIHKNNAYRQAAETLAGLGKKVESGTEAKKLKGIGPKIAIKIDEFLKTGTLNKLEKIHKDVTSEAILLMTRVSGIGPTKARQLVEAGVLTLDELEQKNSQLGLNHHQQIGIKYFHDFEAKIPRKEIEGIEIFVKKKILTLDSKFHITICGSYRRGQDESGDIDVLVSHPSFDSSSDKKIGAEKLNYVVETLEKNHFITDTMSKGDVKFMGVCNARNIGVQTGDGSTGLGLHRRLDIRMCPWDQYFCSMLYFTGSDLFNKNMRLHALQNNFTLNEYSLRPIGSTGVPGEPVPIDCEKDIFSYIKYTYRDPKDRNN